MDISLSHQSYYNNFVLEYLQAYHLSSASSLVHVFKNGRREVFKKSLKEIHPLSKDFLAAFSKEHPEVLQRYKKLMGLSNPLSLEELQEGLDERVLARAFADQIREIPSGRDDASQFHAIIMSVLEFLFYPNLIYPRKEQEINEGRKRIDISYTNDAVSGFFFRIRLDQNLRAAWVMVECKNYAKEIANPELDQIAGRFSRERGRFGFLVGRSFDNRSLFIQRCRDTLLSGHGCIIPIVDDDLHQWLTYVAEGDRNSIDRDLQMKLVEIQS